jgi:hypothetical protein
MFFTLTFITLITSTLAASPPSTAVSDVLAGPLTHSGSSGRTIWFENYGLAGEVWRIDGSAIGTDDKDSWGSAGNNRGTYTVPLSSGRATILNSPVNAVDIRAYCIASGGNGAAMLCGACVHTAGAVADHGEVYGNYTKSAGGARTVLKCVVNDYWA